MTGMSKLPPQEHEQVWASGGARSRFHRLSMKDLRLDVAQCAPIPLHHSFYWPSEIEDLNAVLAVKLTPCPKCFGETEAGS